MPARRAGEVVVVGYEVGVRIHSETSASPPVDERLAQSIFYGLVPARGRRLPIGASRAAGAARWGVTIDQLKVVERAGTRGQWAPPG